MPDFFNVERVPQVLQEQVRGPGEGLENGEANLMQRAMAMRRGQTATPGRGPRGIAPLAKNVLDSKKAVNTALGIGDEDEEALRPAAEDPNTSSEQYTALARERLAAKGKEKPRYQSAQLAAQPKPGEGGGSMTITKSPDMSAKEWAEGHARLQQAMPGSGNTMQSVLNPGEESEQINFGAKGQAAQAQDTTSAFTDALVKGAGGDKDLAAQLQAYQTAGANPAQLHEMASQFTQRQEQAETHKAAIEAHGKEMNSRLAQQLKAHLEKRAKDLPNEITAAKTEADSLVGDPKQAAAQTHYEQLLKDQADVDNQYKDLMTAPGSSPESAIEVQDPSELAKYPKGTHFKLPDGRIGTN